MTEKERQPWLQIHDPQLSSDALIARVEQRVQQRRQELGPPSERRLPAGPQGQPAVAALQEALRQLQELPPPATHPALAASPATRLPLLGRLWTLVRAQAHHLVLFYVNRHLAHQAQVNHLTANVLHELAALLLAQQQEIDRLRSRLGEDEQETGAPNG